MKRTLLSALVVLIPFASAAAHDEVAIGRSSTNQLVAHYHATEAQLVPRSIFPGISGYAISLIGFESTAIEEPDEDLFFLAPSCNVRARLVGVDSGGVLYNGLPVLEVGQSMEFGSPDFDYHPIFSIAPTSAAHGQIFNFRFILHDESGLYADSEELLIALTPACPADVDASGTVTVQDLFDYLGLYFRGTPVPAADINNSGTVSVQDIFDYLAAFFEPCT